MTLMRTLVLALVLPSFTLPLSALADVPTKPRYKKREIVEARFGNEEKRAALARAYRIKSELDAKVFGQERATFSLQEALIQYYESFGTRTREPVALHFIGLPGIGKSVMIDELSNSGYNVVKIDMQTFLTTSADYFASQIRDHVQKQKGKPFILVFDELDKIPEITHEGEITRGAVGVLNDILTDGKFTAYGNRIDVSNALVMTTMNFSPAEIESFSEKVLGTRKSFYEFTLEDFARFDQWLVSNPGARYEVLSRLFRSNTVSRLAPNTSIFKALDLKDYRKIARGTAERTAERLSGGAKSKARVEVQFTSEFAEYLADRTIVPASGARETVFRVDRLTEQVIGFATKYQPDELENTLDRPRQILLDLNTESNRVRVTITPYQVQGKSYRTLPPFQFEVEYREDVRLFDRPVGVRFQAPKVSPPPIIAEKPASRREILSNRFPKNAQAAKGLAGVLDQQLIGQEQYTALLEREMNQYLSRPGPALKEPSSLIFAGFPGIGKSELVNRAGAFLDLPIVRIGMQQYTADSTVAVESFLADLTQQINTARGASTTGKFILLIEEIDKIFEVHPQTGAVVSRPVMGVLKDLLASGTVTARIASDGGGSTLQTLNIQDSFTFITMNFGVDLFGFEADPRLTTADDMIAAWKRLSTRPSDLKQTLSKLFLPETISRLMPKFNIMKPLSEEEYSRLIDGIVERAMKQRMMDRLSGRDLVRVEVKLTPEYRRYLLNETVIPSEGARYTVNSVESRVLQDLEAALKAVPKSGPLAAKPFELSLDFSMKSSTVTYTATASGAPSVALGQREIVLTFPRPEQTGMLDPTRTLVSIHEFGHAFSAVRLGLRFETATVIPPSTGTGGYVKYVDNGMSARAMVARLYSTLAARAFERMFYSENPLAPESVMDITRGASGDIKSATENIFQQLHALGFDPYGGTLYRPGTVTQPQAKFEDLPQSTVEALGRIMRDMETGLIRDFLEAHPLEWYREKILAFGRAGTTNEKQFYELIGYSHPGGRSFIGDSTTIQRTMKGATNPLSKAQAEAISILQPGTKTTAAQNMEASLKRFQDLIREHLYGGKSKYCGKLMKKQSREK